MVCYDMRQARLSRSGKNHNGKQLKSLFNANFFECLN